MNEDQARLSESEQHEPINFDKLAEQRKGHYLLVGGSGDPFAFSELANKVISQGYCPIGGVAFMGHRFFQAFVKETDSKE